ncbi:MAG: ABC transporter substrate-binding protein [Thermodesulfobacteriota bacterium]
MFKRIRASIGLSLLLLAVSVPAVPAGDRVKIGAIYSLTGEAAADNLSEVRGVRLAAAEINQNGGVLGRELELLFFDNLSMPIGSKKAAEQAAAAGVTAIVGCSWSTHSLAAARVAQANKIPLVSSFSTTPKLTLIGDYIFRACYTDPFQGLVLARFSRRDLKAATAVVMKNITSEFSLGLADEFTKQFQRLGGQVLSHLNYKQNQDDFDSLLARVIAADPEVLFLAGYYESGRIAKRAQEVGVKAVMLGGDGWGAEAFYQMGGRSIRHAYFCTAWSPEMDTPKSRSFVEKYQAQGVDAAVAQGYDTLMLVADAVRRAGSDNPEAVRKALAETRDFEGVTGPIRFDENRNPIKSVVINEIVNGTEKYLKTAPPED